MNMDKEMTNNAILDTSPGLSAEALRDDVLKTGKAFMDVFKQKNMQKLIKEEVNLKEYETTEKQYYQLKNQEYKIGVAAGQSAGKSSLINAFILEYPLLPFCTGITTCVPTIIRYSKSIRIDITVQGNNSEKGRTISLQCGTGSVRKNLFNKLVDYYALCMDPAVLALGNGFYFTKKPVPPSEGMPMITSSDLNLSLDDPKQVAMLLLTVLCAYVKNNVSKTKLKPALVEAQKRQKEILKTLGLKETDKDYTVTVFWDSPLLKKGLVFYDLPGLDADVEERNGFKSHEDITKDALGEVQSMLYVFKPNITREGTSAIETMLARDSIQQLKSKQDRVLVVINRADTQTATSLANDVTNAQQTLQNYDLAPNVYPISSLVHGEKIFVDNGIVDSLNTSAAGQIIDFWQDYGMNVDFRTYDIPLSKLLAPPDTCVKHRLEVLENQYNPSKFIEILNQYADKAILINLVEFLNSLYILTEKVYESIKKIIRFLKNANDDAVAASQELANALKTLVEEKADAFIVQSTALIEERIKDKEEDLEQNFSLAVEMTLDSLSSKMDMIRDRAAADFALLPKDMWNNVILYRERDTGNEYTAEYHKWEKIKADIRRSRFSNAFKKQSEALKALISGLLKTYTDMDADIEEKLKETLDGTGIQVDNIVSKAGRDSVYCSFFENVGIQYKQIVDNCKTDIRKDLKSRNNTSNLLNNLSEKAQSNQVVLEKEVTSMLDEMVNSSESTGVFRERTHLLPYYFTLDRIKETFTFSTKQRETYHMVLAPNLTVRGHCDVAKKGKTVVLSKHIDMLKTKTRNLEKTLKNFDANGRDDQIREYSEMLYLLSKTIDDNKKELNGIIKSVQKDKNEKSNIAGVDFNKFENQY